LSIEADISFCFYPHLFPQTRQRKTEKSFDLFSFSFFEISELGPVLPPGPGGDRGGRSNLSLACLRVGPKSQKWNPQSNAGRSSTGWRPCGRTARINRALTKWCDHPGTKAVTFLVNHVNRATHLRQSISPAKPAANAMATSHSEHDPARVLALGADRLSCCPNRLTARRPFCIQHLNIGAGSRGPPVVERGPVVGVASASAIQPKISEMGPWSHEMAVIQGQNLVVVG
jgi:hypothetical protein